MYAPKKQLV